MKANKNKSALNVKTVKKSVSFPADLWLFVEMMAGPYGENSKVVQDAIRQMRDKLEKSGNAKIKDAANQIYKGIGE